MACKKTFFLSSSRLLCCCSRSSSHGQQRLLLTSRLRSFPWAETTSRHCSRRDPRGIRRLQAFVEQMALATKFLR